MPIADLTDASVAQTLAMPKDRFQDYHLADLYALGGQSAVKAELLEAILSTLMMTFRFSGNEQEKIVYGPTPITSGYPAEQAVRHSGGALRHTADILKPEHAAILGRVIQQNLTIAEDDGLRFRQSPAFTAIGGGEPFYVNPIAVESLGHMRRRAAKSTGDGTAKLGQADFMTLWDAFIRHFVDVMVQKDETSPWHASTGGIQEIVIATCVEAGLVASRPQADMTMVDRDTGAYVTLDERMDKIAQTIHQQHQDGMLTGPSAGRILTAFARLASIADWLESDHPLVEAANPALRQFDRANIAELIAYVTPLLVERLALEPQHLNTEGLSDRYQALLFAGLEQARLDAARDHNRDAA